MENEYLRLSKDAYSIDAIRAALLSFDGLSLQIDDTKDDWILNLAGFHGNMSAESLLRRIDEFYLREQLERRFGTERDALFTLAFGKENYGK